METVVQPPADAELHLLTEWGDPADGPRHRRAAVLSVLFHAVVIAAAALVPASFLAPPPRTEASIVTPLVEPRLTRLTQPEPNKGKVNKEFDAAAIKPLPGIRIAPGVSNVPKPQPFHGPPPAPAPRPKAMTVPEPPKIQADEAKPGLPKIPETAPPRIQAPPEQPKLALENVPVPPSTQPGQGRPLPKVTAADAIRGALGGSPGGIGPGIDLPPAPGMQPNNMQLLSDPMGVDFKPYLARVLAAVKSYWMAIWPDSARMGRSGRVAIQFSIDRIGQVPKLVIASPSGVQSLDRAAVAAISGSVPFPPLPREFRGDLIKLQLNFAYNMPK